VARSCTPSQQLEGVCYSRSRPSRLVGGEPDSDRSRVAEPAPAAARTRLYALLARNVIASIKEGRVRLIPVGTLEQYIQRRLAEQCPPSAAHGALETQNMGKGEHHGTPRTW
jgi:hypothetical protein